MRRRELIAGLGSAAAWPVAQQGNRVRRIGVLLPGYENDPMPTTNARSAIRARVGLSASGITAGFPATCRVPF